MYIGQSTNIYSRWGKHKSELRRGVHYNEYLQKSWNAHGEESFKFKILEKCDETELDEKEKYYINIFRTTNRDYGYNLKEGGQLNGCYPTDEIRKKLSDAIKQSYTDELRKKKSELAYKQWSNPEIKEKIMGRNNGMYGKTHSEESRQKIREKAIGRPSPKRYNISVRCIELDKIYEMVSDASKEFGLNTSNILQVCEGIRKTCGGYHWEYYNLENKVS